ncbi:EAL domain-containing protein [Pelotomaculum isophthalicicum JI]|uniref:EAL domain-containing protein n=1 Tax=Pelotomaculum isophthalicicum JI TaxID=947010 RepID=A0A9X4GXT8_9FIRM|nr:EAL domain-containing protein [Pelotomaculum isophthalicicum]MDF9407145.1 EAL domain-containing protein [Pelotomaculum isophthalicicum JI]
MDNSIININNIIYNENIRIYFQPIISVKKKSIIGFESLCRGLNTGTNKIISPDTLFEFARHKNMNLELDRLCRKKALEAYKFNNFENKNYILFLNLDTSIMDNGIVGSGHLLNMVKNLDLFSNNIVIEIVESKVRDTKSLEKFINTYKEKGYLTALDDVGSGYSNLDRVALVKPDILKIDKGIISYIDKYFYKQEIFKSLVNLSRKIGALVVAEGVEREEEALVSLELGADMLQGFYFSKPQDYTFVTDEKTKKNIFYIANKFNNYMTYKIKSIKLMYQEYYMVLSNIINELSNVTCDNFDDMLSVIIQKYTIVECIYIINESGTQITETFCDQLKIKRNSKIYGPAKKGTEHSLKDYYYYLMSTGSTQFTTEPYISLASGNLCITISSQFEDVNSNRFILCIDIKVLPSNTCLP